MKRRPRLLLAAAALAAAAATSGCESIGDEFSAFLLDSAVSGIQESLVEQDCYDRYTADYSSRARCEADGGF